MGSIAASASVLVFLVLLLFATQLIFNLYATSVVNAAGLDAARQVAGNGVSHDDPDALEAAERRARALLGSYGDRARFTWSVDGDRVSLRIEVDRTEILPHSIADGVGLDEIDRTVTVRTERFR